jgi:hypothetical protein
VRHQRIQHCRLASTAGERLHTNAKSLIASRSFDRVVSGAVRANEDFEPVSGVVQRQQILQSRFDRRGLVVGDHDD